MNLIQIVGVFLLCLALTVPAGAQTAQNVAQSSDLKTGRPALFLLGGAAARTARSSPTARSHMAGSARLESRDFLQFRRFSYLQVSLPMSFRRADAHLEPGGSRPKL